MISYIFIGTSNHPKATITFEALNRIGYFSPSNCIVITNKEEGDFPELARNFQYDIHIVKNDLEVYGILKQLQFDYLISCGWHLKISEKVLKLPKKLALNSHSSYLPDYKGLGAYKHAWANGEKYSGNTLHIMDEEFDTGTILAQAKVRIYWWDTPKTLLKRIAKETPGLIAQAIEKYNNGDIQDCKNSTKGRYFLKTSNSQLVKYRLYNLIAGTFGVKKKLTKYK